MIIAEAIQNGLIVEVTEYSNPIWPGYTVHFSGELYHFLGLVPSSLEQVIQELLADVDHRIDIDALEQYVDHLVEVLIGEIPDWYLTVRIIGEKQLLIAQPRDDVSQLELTE
jgi:hypothetical protein